MDRYQALVAEIARELPGFRIVRKDSSAVQRAIHHLLAAVTLGGQRRYLDAYQTTIGRTVYVTADWEAQSDAERYVTMRHERIHLLQFERLGVPLMGLLYLAVLPAGLAYFRARFEKEAYAESIRAAAEVWGKQAVVAGDFREHVISQFTTGNYGWMWPFRGAMERWYDAVIAAL